MIELYQVVGILGVIFLISAILLKKRMKRTPLFILGGVFLGIYSWFIGDVIFIALQVIYTIASVYEYFELDARRPWKKRQSGHSE